MAIKRPRKETKKPASAAAGGSGSSLSMVEMPPHGPVAGENTIQPPPPLPPGVYFSPTKEECLGFLNRSIAGDNVLPDARGYIFRANLYGESPDALRRRHPPASTREGDHTWWFLSETKFQNETSRTKRADRRVGAVEYWRLEQTKTKLKDDGLKNCFGFYTGPDRINDKTAWLMQEFTSTKDDGAGKRGVPALYRVYVTPHATADQLREIYGEDGVEVRPDGKAKPARPKVPVPNKYFDAIAALLPQGSVRAGGQHHGALPQAPPPPPPRPVALAGLLDYHGQQGQYLGQYHQGQYYQQHEQWAAPGPFSEVAPPIPPPAWPSVVSEVAADMPRAIAKEQPAEAGKEEPDWGSLDNIVDDDELKNFNKEG